MALYLISYDINEKDAFEYDGLWDRLKELGAVRILYSEWVVSANTGQASAIYGAVAPRHRRKIGCSFRRLRMTPYGTSCSSPSRPSS